MVIENFPDSYIRNLSQSILLHVSQVDSKSRPGSLQSLEYIPPISHKVCLQYWIAKSIYVCLIVVLLRLVPSSVMKGVKPKSERIPRILPSGLPSPMNRNRCVPQPLVQSEDPKPLGPATNWGDLFISPAKSHSAPRLASVQIARRGLAFVFRR